MADLTRELNTYQQLLPTLLVHQGKFALIADDHVLDVFSTYEDAIKAGYAQRGLQPFLVKRIVADEPVMYFTRDLQTPCPV